MKTRSRPRPSSLVRLRSRSMVSLTGISSGRATAHAGELGSVMKS